jgi:hypothetical protein
MSSNLDVQSNGTHVFRGEIAPWEHIAQFYEHDSVLLDTLVGFIGGGLKAGESAIVIATPEHLRVLEERLAASSVDVATARSQDQYITLEAEEALAMFMVKQWPDDKLFSDLVTELITRARANGRCGRSVRWSLCYGHGVMKRLPFGSNTCGIRYARVRNFRYSARIRRRGLLRTLPNR